MFKSLFLAAALAFFAAEPPVVWLVDFEKARAESIEKSRPILLVFSGSDWCGPCIRLKKEVFDDALFQTFAAENLVLVAADFPRSTKKQPSKKQAKALDQLAERFDPDGIFPRLVLISADQKILKIWDGRPAVGSLAAFLDVVKSFEK